jgi:anti-sigma-K factor RskA
MNGHPTREEDFDLYALGALEGEERQAIESHLTGCRDCARKLAEAQGRIALLALAAPPVAPAEVVKQRLMSQIRADAERTAPERVAPETPVAGKVERDGGFVGRWWAAVLVPVGATLAIATIFLWNENRHLNHQLDALYSTVRLEQQQLDEARQVAELLASSDTITVPLAQQPGMPAGSAHVSYNQKTGMLMYDGALAPAPSDKSYQLWLVPVNGKPISAGVFNPTFGLPDHWMVGLPPGTAPKAFAVSLEPAGGVPQPTGPMVLVGPAS